MKETAEIEINLRCTKRKEEATKFQEGEHKWLGKREKPLNFRKVSTNGWAKESQRVLSAPALPSRT